MKKKYYFILLALILVTASLYIIMGKGGTNPEVIVEAYEKEWGIVLTPPSVETSIYASPKTSDATGQWVTLYSYEEQPDFQASEMQEMTSENLTNYKNRLKKFEEQTLAKYTSSEQKEINKAFEEHHPTIKAGDYGYYKEKNDGKDYFLAIYENKKLYTYTWHE